MELITSPESVTKKVPINTSIELCSHYDYYEGYIFTSELTAPLKQFIREKTSMGLSDEVYGALDITPKDTVAAIDEVLATIVEKANPFAANMMSDLEVTLGMDPNTVQEFGSIMLELEKNIHRVECLYGVSFDRLSMHPTGVFLLGEVFTETDKYQLSDTLEFLI